jgi:hypothetical protein
LGRGRWRRQGVHTDVLQDPPDLHPLGDERKDAFAAATKGTHQRKILVDARDQHRPQVLRPLCPTPTWAGPACAMTVTTALSGAFGASNPALTLDEVLPSWSIEVSEDHGMTELKISKGSANFFEDLGFGVQESQN